MKKNQTNDSKMILILIPVALTILKMLVYIPVNVTGGLTNLNYNTHTHIIKIVSSNTHISKCEDCVHYSLIAGKYWIENLIVFGVCFAIVLLFYIFTSKPTKKKNESDDIEVGNNNVMGLNIIRNNGQDAEENQMINVSNDDSNEMEVPTTIGENNVEQSVQTIPVEPQLQPNIFTQEVQPQEENIEQIEEINIEPTQSVTEMPVPEIQPQEENIEQIEEINIGPTQSVTEMPVPEVQPQEENIEQIEEINIEPTQSVTEMPSVEEQHYPMPNEYTFENVETKEE